MNTNIEPKRVLDYLEDLVILIEATGGDIPMTIKDKAQALDCIRQCESFLRLKEFVSETY